MVPRILLGTIEEHRQLTGKKDRNKEKNKAIVRPSPLNGEQLIRSALQEVGGTLQHRTDRCEAKADWGAGRIGIPDTHAAESALSR